MSDLDVYYTRPYGHGWGQLERLARLAARELGGRLIVLSRDAAYSRLHRARALAPKVRGSRRCLVIAPLPAHLYAAVELRALMRQYGVVAGWVIDSFLWEMVPLVARRGRYDYLYVTDPADLAAWTPHATIGCRWLPWGCDTVGALCSQKSVDLLRVGRQPPEWDDDDVTRSGARAMGVSFEGRPPFGASPMASQEAVLNALARAKYTLAFSNLVDASDYTHNSRAYMTGRWTDALAHGAIVAGITPDSEAARQLLWDGATLDLGGTERSPGLARIQEALGLWTEERAEHNRMQARRRLDWRHSLCTIAEDLELDLPALRETAALLASA
jgi:hypothetical protein